MTGPLDIAWVLEHLDARRGGRERSVAEVACALAARGHDVSILCQAGRIDAAGVEVVELGTAGASRAARIADFSRRVAACVARERFDIVHATLPVAGANVYQPRGGTVPGILQGRLRATRPAWRGLRRWMSACNLGRRATLRLEQAVMSDPGVTVLAVSEAVADEVRRHYGRRDVQVVYSGVGIPDADEATRAAWRAAHRRQWGAADGECVFLTAANNLRLKGVDWAIRALAQFLAGGRAARLIVAGGDRGDGPFRRLARRMGIADRVAFVGGVPDMFPLYSAADVVVLLSWQDACSRVVLEAVRWGVPSITTRYNGAAEALADGAGKVVAAPDALAEVAAAMEALADPPGQRRAADACARAAAHLSVERQVADLEAAYRRIAAK